AAQTGAVTEHTNVDSSGNLNAGGAITFSDVDLTDTHAVTFAAGGNNYLGTFTPTLTHDATGGSTGTVGWTFAVSHQAVEFLATGQTLTQTYTVIVTDIYGASSTQLVTITITGTNDAPVIAVGAGDSAGTGLTETNAGLTTNGTLTVTDADLSDTVTPTVPLVTLSGVTGGLTSADVLGMLQVSPTSIAANPGDTHNLNWSFNSGSQAFNFLARKEPLTLTYPVKVDAGHPAGTATQAVTIIITGTDDAPVITSTAETGAVTEDTNVDNSGNLNAGGIITFTDVDLTDTHTV